MRSLSLKDTGTVQFPTILPPVMVQTAAASTLPFCVKLKVRVARPPGAADNLMTMRALAAAGMLFSTFAISVALLQVLPRFLRAYGPKRSEERRVGKECR